MQILKFCLIFEKISSSWSGFGDELGWSAAWMWRATGESKYLEEFQSHWQEFGLGGRPQEFSWDDKKAGLQVKQNMKLVITIS